MTTQVKLAPWVVDEYAELAYKWAHEDATEGRPSRPLGSWVADGPEHSSYLQGYADGLALLELLVGNLLPWQAEEWIGADLCERPYLY